MWRIKPPSIILANIIWSVGRKRWWSFFPPYSFTLFASEPWSNKLFNCDSYYILVPIKIISWFRSWQHTITFLHISNFSKNFLVSRGKLFHYYKKKKNLIFPSNFLKVLEESIYNAALWFCRIRRKKELFLLNFKIIHPVKTSLKIASSISEITDKDRMGCKLFLYISKHNLNGYAVSFIR